MGSIQGTVKATSGVTPPEVTVLIDSGPPHPDIAALTNEAGQFSLTGLREGVYQVSAYVDGVRQATEQVQVRADAPAVVRLVLSDS